MTDNTGKEKLKSILKKSKRTEIFISTLCILGILVCLYALQVEIYKAKDSSYKAFCDIDGFFSCSKVFMSKLVFYLKHKRVVICCFIF